MTRTQYPLRRTRLPVPEAINYSTAATFHTVDLTQFYHSQCVQLSRHNKNVNSSLDAADEGLTHKADNFGVLNNCCVHNSMPVMPT